MKKHILIFDFDGTIADTHRFLLEIYNRLCADFHYRAVDQEEIARFKNMTPREIIAELKIPLLKIPVILNRVRKEYVKGISRVRPVDGVKEALFALKGPSVLLGILSSNERGNIRAFLENHRMGLFDLVHTTKNILSKHIALARVIRTNGWSKNEIIYVGDEIRDITAARKLGIRIAAVTWGYNSAQALRKHNPDFLFDRPEELRDLLGPDVRGDVQAGGRPSR